MPWARNRAPWILAASVGKTLDEGPADPPPLFLRVDRAGQRRQKFVFRLDDVQVGLEVAGELADDRLLLGLAQQPVVDQDARNLGTDGRGQQRGDDRRIDAPGKPADDPPVADAAGGPPRPFRGQNRPAARCRRNRRPSSENCR